MMPRHVRLLLGTVVPAILAVWITFTTIYLLSTFVNELEEIGTGNYSLAGALSYTLLTLPRTAHSMLSHAVVVGVLVGMGQLAGRSELIALQAAGASRGRIAGLVLIGVLVLTGLTMYGAETVGSQADRQANALAAMAKREQGLSFGTSSGLWMRDGLDIINAGTVVPSDNGMPDLWQVRIYRFDGNGKLQSVVSADDAQPLADGWMLRKVRTQMLGEPIAVKDEATVAWRSSLRADLIASRSLRPRQQSIAELDRSIAYARANGLDDRTLVSAYWYRMVFPLNVLSLALIALPFAFGNLRSGGFSRRLFLGMLLGLGFFFLQRTVVNLFETLDWNLITGHLLSPLLLSLLGFWLLRRGAAR